MQRKNGKIEILEMLRFVAMTGVFLSHYLGDFNIFETEKLTLSVGGALGVAFFFMITAYLLVKTSKPEKKYFLRKKVVSLLPKYEIVLLGVFGASIVMPSLFRTFDISIVNFVRSAFLIPYKTEGATLAFPMLPVGWTLIVQIFVYFVFGIVMKITKNTIKTAGYMIVILSCFCVYGHIVGYEDVFSFTYCRFYMLYFVAGFLVAIIEHKLNDKIALVEKKSPMWICLLSLFAFLVGSCIYEENVFHYALVVIIFALCILLGKNIKFPKAVNFMGKISYSFYLIHYLMCKVFTRIFHIELTSLFGGVMLVICFGITIFVSVIFDYVVDNLVSKMITKKI